MTLLASIKAALNALTSFLNVAPYYIVWLSNNKLENINEEILELEQSGDPKWRSRLGELRVKRKTARELHEAILSRFASTEGTDNSSDT
jgi:hypothetical protein